MSKTTANETTEKFVKVETPVGVRQIPEGSDWWTGKGRGHTREFITDETEMECRVCHDEMPESAFPTFSVPRRDGRTRSDECRGCRNARKVKAAKAAARKAKAAEKKATKAAAAKAAPAKVA